MFAFTAQSYVPVTVHRNKFLLIKRTDAIISQFYFCQEILHVLGSSSAHHRSFPLYIRQWYMSCKFDNSFQARPGWSCLKAVFKFTWHIPLPNLQRKTPDDGQRNFPKHVKFLDKNKFGKLVRLLVSLKKLPVNVRYGAVDSRSHPPPPPRYSIIGKLCNY